MPLEQDSPVAALTHMDARHTMPLRITKLILEDEVEKLGVVIITTNVADVDLPLMSVAQIVYNGGKVVMSPESCYIAHKNGTTYTLEFRV